MYPSALIHPQVASLLYKRLGRKPPKAGPAREAPPRVRAEAAQYTQRLTAVVRTWYDHVETIGRKELGSRHDASFEEQLQDAFDKLVQAAGLDAFLARKAKNIAGKQAQYMKRVTKLPPSRMATQQLIEDYRQTNANLITGMRDDQIARVTAVLREAQSRGQRWEETTPAVKEALGVGMDRARLIARDQTNKFNGSMMQVTQTSAGIERYTWSTTRAPSVRGFPGGPNTRKNGHNHYILEGKEFGWDDPPVLGPDGMRGHPGVDINCECVAIPKIPFFEDSAPGRAQREEGIPHEALFGHAEYRPKLVNIGAVTSIGGLENAQYLRAGYRPESLEAVRAAPEDKLPPVTVDVSHTGGVSLVDGRHRLSVAAERGRKMILAHVRQRDIEGDIVATALANLPIKKSTP